MMSTISRPRVPTLEKVATLLGLFTPTQPAWRLGDIARELGWDKATALRILNALVDTRFLERAEDGVFEVGVLPVELGAVYLSRQPNRRRVLSEMRRLAESTNLTTQVGVLDGGYVTIIASQEAQSAVKAAAMLGERLPIHASAVGKAILSQLDDSEIKKLLPKKLARFTEATITDREHLLAEIATVRSTGISLVNGEFAEGLCAVAVAIPRGYFGSALAGLTCAGAPPSIVPAAWQKAEELLRSLDLGAPRFGHEGDSAGDPTVASTARDDHRERS